LEGTIRAYLENISLDLEEEKERGIKLRAENNIRKNFEHT
jgi:hypothetical protein